MLCVDDYSRFKIVRFLKHKNQVAGALEDIIASHISPAGLKIGIIRTDGGGEFEGEFQDLLNNLGIKHEKTPPYSPQYNGVAERALGILRDKTVALLRSLIAGNTNRLWAEAMRYACDMSNMCVTASLDQGVTPHELWYGDKPSLSGIIPFGTVGYMRHHNPPNKLAPRGNKCILLGTAMDRPAHTYRVRDLTTGSVVLRQSVTWHPSPQAQVSTSAKPGGVGYKNSSSRRPHLSSSDRSYSLLPTITEEDETEPNDTEEPSDTDPDNEMPVEPDLPGEADEPEEAGTKQQPAAVRKLADYHTGEIQAMLPTRTRSGGLTALLSVALKAETAALETRKVEDALATKAASIVTTPREMPEEPTTLKEAKESAEWPQWRGAFQREMEGQLSRGVWTPVNRPLDRTTLGTRLVFKMKMN